MRTERAGTVDGEAGAADGDDHGVADTDLGVALPAVEQRHGDRRDQLAGPRAVRLTPVMNSPTGSARTPSGPAARRWRRARRAPAGRHRPASTWRGCRRSSPRCGSAASRRCGPPGPAPAAARRAAGGDLGVGARRRRGGRSPSPGRTTTPAARRRGRRRRRSRRPPAALGLVDLDHQVGAAGEHEGVGMRAERGHRVVEGREPARPSPPTVQNVTLRAARTSCPERQGPSGCHARPPGCPGGSRTRSSSRLQELAFGAAVPIALVTRSMSPSAVGPGRSGTCVSEPPCPSTPDPGC